MTPVPRARVRSTALAFGLGVALVGCGGGGGGGGETSPPANDPGPGVEEAAMAVALDGLSFEVHRDPG